MRGARAVVVIAFACGLCAAAACASFSGSSGGPNVTPDGAPVDAPSDGDVSTEDAGVDATPGDIPTCPVAAYAAMLSPPDGLPKRTLFTHGPGTAYPQQIVLDRQFVYWVEQTTNGAPYGAARVLRADRSGAPASVVVIAADEPGVRTLALDGPYVYWARTDDASTSTTLVRAPRTCTSCAAQIEVVTAELQERVWMLRSVAPGVLFGFTAEDHVVRYDLGASAGGPSVSKFYGEALTSTSAEAYSAHANTPSIEQIDFDFTHNTLPITIPDGGTGYYAGYNGLATDCEALWGGRRRINNNSALPAIIERIDLDSGAVDAASTGVNTLFPDHLAVDARYVYIASVNGGLYVHDRVARTTDHIDGTQTIAVAVDDQGIYWGSLSTGNIEMMVKK
jgi:hypothetical protein